VAFTDNRNISSHDWEIRPLVWSHPDDPVRTARYHKHNPHLLFPECRTSIWLDATHWPCSDLLPLLNCIDENDIAAMKHFGRNSSAAEAKACAEANADQPATILEQWERYRQKGFPDDLGLFSTTCLIRRHTPKMVELQRLWWEEIQRGSRRDQISFTYCLWKLGLKCGIVPGFCRCGPSPFFKMKSHYGRDPIKLL
jgi:hypothetical protein